MNNFNEEILAKAKKLKSVEELLTLAKENNIPLTREQAQDIYVQLNQKSGELSDDELDNVAGGGCYNGEGQLIVTAMYGSSCDFWKCINCGSTETTTTIDGRDTVTVCKGCGTNDTCPGCSYCVSQGGLVLCSHPSNKI